MYTSRWERKVRESFTVKHDCRKKEEERKRVLGANTKAHNYCQPGEKTKVSNLKRSDVETSIL